MGRIDEQFTRRHPRPLRDPIQEAQDEQRKQELADLWQLAKAQQAAEPESTDYAAERARCFSHWLGQNYIDADRQALADAAYDAAIADVPPAYMNPHIRSTTRMAVQIALGLKALPEQEGEQ